MRAVVITSHGGVDGIGVLEVDTPPAPTADRARVRVHAAGLNRADILQRRGHYPAPPGYPQNIPGMEFAGEVESIGDAVRAWKVGDRVFGITGGGAQAEFVVVPESNLARIPPELDWVEAGAMPEVFITAHDALFTRAGLHMDERVLIHSAASGVGTAAIQVAHAVGAIAWWWLAPASYAARPARVDRVLHGFMVFVVFNATVVYESGFIRWAGLALTEALARLWLLRCACRGGRHAATTAARPAERSPSTAGG